MKKTYTLLLICFLLVACGGEDKKPPLEGKRIPIILDTLSLQANPNLQSVKPEISAPRAPIAWTTIASSSEHNIGNLSYSLDFNERWNRNIGSGDSKAGRLFAEPVVAGGKIYSMDSKYQLSALDSETGKILWQLRLPFEKGKSGLFGASDGGAFGGGLALYKGRVFATSGHGILYAVDAENGEILWQEYIVTPIRAAPTVARDVVLVSSIDNRTLAFQPEDGQLLWSHQGFQESVGVVGTGAAAIVGNLAVVPYSSGEIYGLRLNDGSVVWQENLSASLRSSSLSELGDISANPVIHQGRMIAVSNGGRLISLDLRSGQQVWNHRLSSKNTPAVSGNYMFILSNSSQLLAIRTADGAIVWTKQLPHWKNPNNRSVIFNWQGPTLLQGQLFLSNQFGDALLVSTDNGEVEREFKLPSVAKGPVVVQGRLYFLHSNGTVRAYD